MNMTLGEWVESFVIMHGNTPQKKYLGARMYLCNAEAAKDMRLFDIIALLREYHREAYENMDFSELEIRYLIKMPLLQVGFGELDTEYVLQLIRLLGANSQMVSEATDAALRGIEQTPNMYNQDSGTFSLARIFIALNEVRQKNRLPVIDKLDARIVGIIESIRQHSRTMSQTDPGMRDRLREDLERMKYTHEEIHEHI